MLITKKLRLKSKHTPIGSQISSQICLRSNSRFFSSSLNQVFVYDFLKIASKCLNNEAVFLCSKLGTCF